MEFVVGSIVVVGGIGLRKLYHNYDKITSVIRAVFNLAVNEQKTLNIRDEVKSMTLIYERLGKCYNLTVPYNREKIANSIGKRVYLVKTEKDENGKERDIYTEITHQPGIPYFVCAREMGGYKFAIKDIDDELTYTDDIPEL